MKLKYTMLSNGHWLYQRRYPKALQGHPQVKKSKYVKTLGVTSKSSDEEILKAWKVANEDFETYISTLQLTNISQLAQAEKIRRAKALLKASDLTRGMLAEDPTMSQSQT